jgi:A/G-specific adenine glycosylase
MTPVQFQKIIREHYAKNKRPMPWRRVRNRRDPYRILVSEIMLQQTQVARVTSFYEKFIKEFPDLKTLARIKTSAVLRAWQGLGYNRRALALQKLAKEVVEKHDGKLPRGREALESLPGIGPYTAGAIRTFAFNEPEIFIETNIRRVFIHFFFPPGKTGKSREKKVTDTELQRYIKSTLDRKNPREWYWALMDYGAMLGELTRKGARGNKTSKTGENPNRRSSHYTRQSKFAGSNREIRGKILREVLAKKKMSVMGLDKKVVFQLVREGFIVKKGREIRSI